MITIAIIVIIECQVKDIIKNAAAADDDDDKYSCSLIADALPVLTYEHNYNNSWTYEYPIVKSMFNWSTFSATRKVYHG